MPNLGPTELIIILLIVILLFGAKKIPEIAKGLGKGIKDFKGAMKEEEAATRGDTKSVSGPTGASETTGSTESHENRPSA
jgi:sec-independent protein translocase protein TatA